MAVDEQTPAFLKSDFPVLFPSHPAFFYSPAKFQDFCKTDLEDFHRLKASSGNRILSIRASRKNATADDDHNNDNSEDDAHIESVDATGAPEHPFVHGLLNTKTSPQLSENHMLTENSDVAYRSSQNPLVDLFHELEELVATDRLTELLASAWNTDAASTLKIIFNARSIHLGKSSRHVFYRCIDWLSTHHPITCLFSLQWLPRPVIEKKAKEEGGEEDAVFVEPEKGQDDPTRFDVRNGVAHGYYKDLLNILALTVQSKLSEPRSVLNVDRRPKNDKAIIWDSAEAAKQRHDLRDTRYDQAVASFEQNAFHRCLHIMIARIFASQLRDDLKLLRNGDKEARRQISLCAKWAPSSKAFHDKHTFIVSSIAELLHSQDEFEGISGRELYLRHAREAYRKDVAALRKELEVVERDLSANSLQNVNYERVPSLAMSKYSKIFAKKDQTRFGEYLQDVAAGKAQISGATLLPSTMIHEVRRDSHNVFFDRVKPNRPGSVEANMAKAVVDSQWRTLVQRIKESGTLESSIAVCDVSGSMNHPNLADGTVPMDSAIGLSLLLAEVVKPPFGGIFIAFSEQPQVMKIDLSQDLHTKVENMEQSVWGMNTDFVAVFEDLILPMALENKLKQEDMVKRIFVFSDMHFDAAAGRGNKLSSSYERIQTKYRSFGYEMPELIFWNLAGGRGGTAPKPVTADQDGTALVSGYSQGMLKVFLDKGGFEDPEEEEEEELIDESVEQGEGTADGEEVTVLTKAKKQKMNPLSIVKKAIRHKAYDMLEVLD